MESTDKMSAQLDTSVDMGTLPPINGSTINSSNNNINSNNAYPETTTLQTVQYTALSPNDLNSIVNVTREYPFDYATIMFGYMMPFVLVLTLITNTLVVMVLFQRHMRTPTNIVLFTMAIVDLATLLSPSPWYFYIYTLGYHDKFLYPPMACYVHHVMTDVIPVFFHTSSIWLALLLASQRYIYVCHPTLARTWCTVPRVRKAIIIILVIAFLHQLTRFFDNTFTPIEIRINSVKYPACKIDISTWVESINVAVYYTTYFTFRILFVFIIPCVALITLNCLLFRALRRAESKRTELLRTKFKLIGGEQCSVVGPTENLKRSSFVVETNCNNQQIANEVPSSRMMMAINRKPSTSASILGGGRERGSNKRGNSMHHHRQVNMTENNNVDKILVNSGDKSKKFSITLFQTNKQNRGKNNFSNNSAGNLMKVSSASSPTNRTTSDIVKVSRLAGYGARGKLITSGLKRPKEGRSEDEESNGTCSVTSSPSRDNFVHDNVGNNINCSTRHHHHQHYRIDKRGFAGGYLDSDNDLNEENDDGDEDYIRYGRDEDGDEFTCLECATCQVDLECQRCSSGGAKDGATGGDGCSNHHNHGYHHRHLHQAISQCSSLMEGATNTTTNDEDVSSCAIIPQNASSSMYVMHDANSETIETTSMQGGSNHLARKDSTPLPSTDHSSSATESTTKDIMGKSGPLTGSESIDSRLICGCLASTLGYEANFKPQDGHHARSVAIRGGKSGGHCRECCMEKQCKISSLISRAADGDFKAQELGYSASRKLAKSKHSKCATTSCSNSDPCMNCNLDNCLDRMACGRTGDGDHCVDEDVGADMIVRPPIPTSQSDYAGETGGGENHTNPYDASSETRPPCTNTTTTTTTTTLYSTKTNSIGSLLQVQQNNQSATQAKGAQAGASSQSSAMHSAPAAYMKSPSIASTTGQGSRAALGNGGGPITNVSGPIQGAGPIGSTTTVAPLRSMDSNRTTLMLIVVVTVFLMVEVPVAISHILHVVFNSFDAFKDIEFASSLNYIKLFTNFFIMISYSVNFTIYCSMSKKFRETFRNLFLCGKRAKRKRAKRLLYQQQQQQQQQSQYTQHHFNLQETQLMPSQANNNNTTNNNLTHGTVVTGNRTHQTDPNASAAAAAVGGGGAGAGSGINHNNTASASGVMRYPSPYSRVSGQQEECEL